MSRMTDEPVMQFKARVASCAKHQDESWDFDCLHCKIELLTGSTNFLGQEYNKYRDRAEAAEAKLARVEGLQQYTLIDNQYVPIEKRQGNWMQRPMIFADELKQALADKEKG